MINTKMSSNLLQPDYKISSSDLSEADIVFARARNDAKDLEKFIDEVIVKIAYFRSSHRGVTKLVGADAMKSADLFNDLYHQVHALLPSLRSIDDALSSPYFRKELESLASSLPSESEGD